MRAVAAYGHTPGHTMCLMEGRGGQILFWGDIIHATAIQFARPELAITYDADPVRAVAVRRRVLAWVAGTVDVGWPERTCPTPPSVRCEPCLRAATSSAHRRACLGRWGATRNCIHNPNG